MASQEVTQLRKARKLQEALEMATEDLQQDPDNVWCKRAISWVYYEFLKTNAKSSNLNGFIDYLTKIKELELGEEENLLFDNCAWQIGSVVFSLQNQQQVNYPMINSIFELIRDFHFTKPSESYSFIYKAFHKGYQNWSKYLEFTTWWGVENFTFEDALPQEFDGRKTMSLLEKASVGISKKLLAVTPIPGLVVDNHDEIREFIPFLNEVIENHPEFQYPVYYKVKLMMKLGDKNVLTDFIPFAKKKKNDYWVWELMAEIVAEDKDLQFSCYCKALSFKGQDEFKINIRQKLANILLQQENFSEAKFEVEKIKKTRELNGWNIPQIITQWVNSEWFKGAEEVKNNFKLYNQHSKKAEEILFQNIEEDVVVVSSVNKEKYIANYIKGKGDSGFFSYKGFIKHPRTGSILKVRIDKKEESGFSKILTLDYENEKIEHDAVKFFNGNIRIGENQNFGFVDDVFVDPDIVSNNALSNHDLVKGKAILSFNKKKSEWGWKAFWGRKS